MHDSALQDRHLNGFIRIPDPPYWHGRKSHNGAIARFTRMMGRKVKNRIVLVPVKRHGRRHPDVETTAVMRIFALPPPAPKSFVQVKGLYCPCLQNGIR